MAELCAHSGIAHRTHAMVRPEAVDRSARRCEARYRLLAEAAASEGVGLMLTGHTPTTRPKRLRCGGLRGRSRACRHGAGHLV